MMSCLVGGVVSYPGPAYTTYELPMRLTSCATIQFSSRRYGMPDGLTGDHFPWTTLLKTGIIVD